MLFDVRREILDTPVQFQLEENGPYARLDDVEEAIGEVLTDICEMEQATLDIDLPTSFVCPGNNNFTTLII